MSDGRMGPIPLRLSTTVVDPSTVVLAVRGEIDIGTVGDLGQAMSQLLGDARTRRLVVDFSEVTFLDASGIAALMAAYRTGQRQQTTVQVIKCQPMPRRALEITGVDKILFPHDDDQP